MTRVTVTHIYLIVDDQMISAVLDRDINAAGEIAEQFGIPLLGGETRIEPMREGDEG